MRGGPIFVNYESLLLNLGGGVTPSGHRARQNTRAATLVIGIGGTGVAALTELKRKVCQDLIPDNSNEPIPRYRHIQFLAIDSDEDVIAGMQGDAKIDPVSDFFLLSAPSLWDALSVQKTIRSNPLFHWMDIDHLPPVFSPVNAYGVRQIGRFFLVSRAAALKAKIAEKCTAALRGLDAPSLHIYILAGLSGGTGSGCFLDTCYIVHKVLEEMGWYASSCISGLFFLPDVILSKPGMAADPACVNRNRANGYAALKELDYHMDLRAACDSFRQDYGAFSVDTRNPPVDLCCLISATRADGSILPNGYSYAIEQAADYIMSHLIDHPNDGLTLHAHLAGVVHGTANLSHRHGANCSYHLLGTANAEIPITQIATYLSAGYYRRFQKRVGWETVNLTRDVVDDWMRKLDLTAEQVFHALCRDCEPLTLPDVEPKTLLQLGVLPKGSAPQCWAMPGEAWLDKCSGRREQNRAALSANLSSFDFRAASAGSLVGRVFRTLCELSMDPEYGPYYAASLLRHAGYDMMSALRGAIKQAEEQLETQKFHFHSENGPLDYVVQCSENLVRHTLFVRRRNYEIYRESVASFYKVLDRLHALEDTLKTLHMLMATLDRLYNSYFRPLLQLLDNLQETFAEDIRYLDSPAAVAPCTTHIPDFQALRPHLDEIIDDLDENALVTPFMTHILNGYDQWQSDDDGKIGPYISRYMEQTFGSAVNRSLQDHLFDRYPDAGGNPYLLSEAVERDILSRLHQDAFPMFLCNPAFDLSDPTVTYEQSQILSPSTAPAVQSAASAFRQANSAYVVYQTRYHNRISVIRCFSGVPLYACGALWMWKHAYDNMDEPYIHLYAHTGRGMDGSRDWYTFLPDPVPVSCTPHRSPDQEALLDLYRRGEEAGIIGTNHRDSLVLFETPPLVLPDYGPEDFWKDHVFQFVPFDAARTALRQRLNDFCNHIPVQEEHPLKDDGDRRLGNAVVAQVRQDHFLRFPVLQQILREELEKLRTLHEALQRLDAIGKELSRYRPDLEDFFDMLFYGILDCTDSMGQPAYNAKTSRILFRYTNQDGLPDCQLLTREGDPDLPYSRSFPFYQAFLSYHALPEASPVRQEIQFLLQQRRAAPLPPESTPILSQLKEAWNSQSIQTMGYLLCDLPTPQEREDVRYFYTQLVEHLQTFTSPC